MKRQLGQQGRLAVHIQRVKRPRWVGTGAIVAAAEDAFKILAAEVAT